MRPAAKHYSLLGALALLSAPTRAAYWINQLNEYSALPVCAEKPVSAIVRGMISGCGDGGRATSYNCFCSTSFSKFNDFIATAVEKECKHSGTEVDSATNLFSAYCVLGKKNEATATQTVDDATTTSNESTTRPTQRVSSAIPSSTASGTATTHEPYTGSGSFLNTASLSVLISSAIPDTTEKLSTTTQGAVGGSPKDAELPTGVKAAIGVCVPLGLVSLVFFAFLLYRRFHRRKTLQRQGSMPLNASSHESRHWPFSLSDDTRLGSAGTGYFVSGSAPVDQHEQWPKQLKGNLNSAPGRLAKAPNPMGQQPPLSSNNIVEFPNSNPFVPAEAANLVFEKPELDGTSPSVTPNYELDSGLSRPASAKKYELE